MAFHFVPSDEVARIRRRLTHPVIDADGHLAEFMPMVIDCVREVADDAVADRFLRFRRSPFTSDEGFLPTRVFFGSPHTLDRMTVTLPKLTYRRAEEIGLDFALLYPSFGLSVLALPGRRGAPGGGPGAEHVLRGGVRRATATGSSRSRSSRRSPPRRRWTSSTTRSARSG